MQDYMDWIVRGFITLFFGMFAWSYRKIRVDLDDVKEDVNKVKLYTMENYLQKKDFDTTMGRVFNELKEIKEKK